MCDETWYLAARYDLADGSKHQRPFLAFRSDDAERIADLIEREAAATLSETARQGGWTAWYVECERSADLRVEEQALYKRWWAEAYHATPRDALVEVALRIAQTMGLEIVLPWRPGTEPQSTIGVGDPSSVFRFPGSDSAVDVLRRHMPGPDGKMPVLEARDLLVVVRFWRQFPSLVAACGGNEENEAVMVCHYHHAVTLIAAAMERHGIDSGPFLRSAELCERVCFASRTERSDRWPDCALSNPTLTDEQRESIQAAEQALGRLQVIVMASGMAEVDTRLQRMLTAQNEEFLDRFSEILTSARATNHATDKKPIRLPQNPDVLKLARLIRQRAQEGSTQKEAALEFTGGDERKAESLLRQLRRYPHLLK